MSTETKTGTKAVLDSLERLTIIHLRNRFVWLAVILDLILIGQLSFMQARYQRFDTLQLLRHITVCLEAGLLAVAVICALATPRIRQAWYEWAVPRDAGRFSYFGSALAGNLVVTLAMVILLLPVLWLHRYPELLTAEQPVSIPLMMLQRAALLLAAVLLTHNVLLILRYYLRLPWTVCALFAIAFHIGVGLGVTYLSYTTEIFHRLNDVFYYNQLWQYSDALPKGWLQRPDIFHNIEQPYFGYYFTALIIWALTMLLLIPQAQKLTAREQTGERAGPDRK
jgi:hypothetical protein